MEILTRSQTRPSHFRPFAILYVRDLLVVRIVDKKIPLRSKKAGIQTKPFLLFKILTVQYLLRIVLWVKIFWPWSPWFFLKKLLAKIFFHYISVFRDILTLRKWNPNFSVRFFRYHCVRDYPPNKISKITSRPKTIICSSG